MDHKAKVRQNRELLRVDRLTDLTLEQLSEGIETCFPSDISRKRFLHVLCSWLGEQVSEASNMNNVPSNELFDRWCRFALNCGHDAKSINNAYEEWTREEQKANSSSPDHDHSIKALCLELAGPFIRDYLGLVGESAGNHGTNVHTYPDRTRSSQREPNPVIGNPLVKEENPIDRGVYMHPDRAKMAQRELSPTSDDHEAKLSISKIDLDGPLIKEEPMNHGSYMHPDRARLSEREPSAGIYDEEEKSPVDLLVLTGANADPTVRSPVIKSQIIDYGIYMHPDRAKISQREPSPTVVDNVVKPPADLSFLTGANIDFPTDGRRVSRPGFQLTNTRNATSEFWMEDHPELNRQSQHDLSLQDLPSNTLKIKKTRRKSRQSAIDQESVSQTKSWKYEDDFRERSQVQVRQEPGLQRSAQNQKENTKQDAKSWPRDGYICDRCKNPGHLIANCPTTFDRSFDTKPPSKFVCSVCRQRGGHWPTLCPQNLHPDSITQKRLCATDSARRERERRDLKPGHGENFRLPSPLDAVPSGRRSYGYDRNYHHRRSRSRSHQGRTKVSRDCRRQRSSHYRPTSPRRGSDRREDYHRDDSKSPSTWRSERSVSLESSNPGPYVLRKVKRNREDEEDELDIDSYRASRRRCLPTASKKEGRLSFYDYEDGSSLETPTSGYNNRSVSWEKTKIVRSIPDREASTFTPAKPLYRVKEKQKNRKVSWEDTELENRLSTPRIMEHRGSPQFLPRFPKQTLEELILTCSRVPIFDSVPGYKPEVDQMSSIFQQTAACEMAFFTDRPSLEEPKAMAHESLPVVKNEPITPIKREPSSPIILGVTEYTLDRDPPYDSSVLKLFKDKTVVWVRKIRRNHAEDLWGDAPEAKITTASEDPKMDEDKEAPQPISAEPQSEPVDLAMDSVMSGCDTPGLTAYESKKAPDVFRNESSRQSVPVDSGVDSGISDSSMEEGEIKESIEAESPEASNKFRN